MPPGLTTNTPHHVPQFTLETSFCQAEQSKNFENKAILSIQGEKLSGTSFSDLTQLIMCLSGVFFFLKIYMKKMVSDFNFKKVMRCGSVGRALAWHTWSPVFHPQLHINLYGGASL